MIIRNPRDLGLLIRKHRGEQSLTQDDLARQIGVSRYWIIDIEKGKPTAQIGFVLRVLTALGLRVDIREQGLAADHRSADPVRRETVDLDHILADSKGSSLDLDHPMKLSSGTRKGAGGEVVRGSEQGDG